MNISKLLGLLALALVVLASSAKEPKKKSDFKDAAAAAASALATNDPVELEYEQLLVKDDVAQKEVDKWIKENQAFEGAGAGIDKATLALKVEQRLALVTTAYEDFISRHPKHTEARLAYGSFLMDIHEEEQAIIQMEKARELDPKNPAAWNNLANHYGHRGPVKKAFEYYAKAIELNPSEPVYLQNLATTTYLFRKDAREFYNIEEQQVFDKALDLYQRAMKLDPTNLVMAVDYAQSYYGIKPMRTNDALRAWHDALKLAKTSDEQQGIFLHLARVEINTGRFDEARQHLDAVTSPEMDDLKKRLERNWQEKRAKALGTSTNNAGLSDELKLEKAPANQPPPP
jgi:Tfp pilus assembly protein PilF